MEKRKGYLMVLAAGIMWGTIGLFTTQLNRYGILPDCLSASGNGYPHAGSADAGDERLVGFQN